MRVRLMKPNKGFTLIELMLALVLGLIVVGGAFSMYIASIRSSVDVNNSARLNYDLDFAMQFMINDIRRAGYWGNAGSGSDASANPFTTIDTSTATCILYSYDADSDGTANNTEFYGFRLVNGVIKITSKDSVDDSGTCSKSGWWKVITDSNEVNVTALTFSDANSSCLNTSTGVSYNEPCTDTVTAGNISTGELAVETRQIDISLTGHIKGESSLTKTLSGIVKVRNDRIFTQP